MKKAGDEKAENGLPRELDTTSSNNKLNDSNSVVREGSNVQDSESTLGAWVIPDETEIERQKIIESLKKIARLSHKNYLAAEAEFHQLILKRTIQREDEIVYPYFLLAQSSMSFWSGSSDIHDLKPIHDFISIQSKHETAPELASLAFWICTDNSLQATDFLTICDQIISQFIGLNYSDRRALMSSLLTNRLKIIFDAIPLSLKDLLIAKLSYQALIGEDISSDPIFSARDGLDDRLFAAQLYALDGYSHWLHNDRNESEKSYRKAHELASELDNENARINELRRWWDICIYFLRATNIGTGWGAFFKSSRPSKLSDREDSLLVNGPLHQAQSAALENIMREDEEGRFRSSVFRLQHDALEAGLFPLVIKSHELKALRSVYLDRIDDFLEAMLWNANFPKEIESKIESLFIRFDPSETVIHRVASTIGERLTRQNTPQELVVSALKTLQRILPYLDEEDYATALMLTKQARERGTAHLNVRIDVRTAALSIFREAARYPRQEAITTLLEEIENEIRLELPGVKQQTDVFPASPLTASAKKRSILEGEANARKRFDPRDAHTLGNTIGNLLYQITNDEERTFWADRLLDAMMLDSASFHQLITEWYQYRSYAASSLAWASADKAKEAWNFLIAPWLSQESTDMEKVLTEPELYKTPIRLAADLFAWRPDAVPSDKIESIIDPLIDDLRTKGPSIGVSDSNLPLWNLCSTFGGNILMRGTEVFLDVLEEDLRIEQKRFFRSQIRDIINHLADFFDTPEPPRRRVTAVSHSDVSINRYIEILRKYLVSSFWIETLNFPGSNDDQLEYVEGLYSVASALRVLMKKHSDQINFNRDFADLGDAIYKLSWHDQELISAYAMLTAGQIVAWVNGETQNIILTLIYGSLCRTEPLISGNASKAITREWKDFLLTHTMWPAFERRIEILAESQSPFVRANTAPIVAIFKNDSGRIERVSEKLSQDMNRNIRQLLIKSSSRSN